MPAEIPAVPSLAEAKLRVAQSRALWRTWREGKLDSVEAGSHRTWDAPGYTYVRAEQRSKEVVDFTLFVVARDRVVLRALIEADPAKLDIHADWKLRYVPRSLWVERGQTVGEHSDAASSRTIDQLYDECERMIFEHPSLKPRLYFHPNGVLMHCGFSREECRECATVSIQSFSLYRVDDETPRDDPAKWVCPIAWGVFAPGSQVRTIEEGVACYAAPPKDSPVPDICRLDHEACPTQCYSDECRRARWTVSWPSPCHMYPTRIPTVLDLGKPKPLGTWGFPFAAANTIECGSD